MGFGQAPFGLSPFGITFTSAGAATVADLSSSRNYDPVRRTYVLDAQGGFSYMDDVYQRVVMLVAFAVETPAIVGQDFGPSVERAVRLALVPLTESKPPIIKIKSVAVDVSSAKSNGILVEFFRFDSATYQIVKAPLVSS